MPYRETPYHRVLTVDEDPATARLFAHALGATGPTLQNFTSLVAFLDWLDYSELQRDTVIAAALGLAELDGLDLINILRADDVFVPTILIGCGLTVSAAVDAMHAGASYLLQKPLTVRSIRRAVEQASCARQPQRVLTRTTADETCQPQLSPRQQQVLERVYAGNTNRQIAAHLGISCKTVELHRAAMMQKIGAKSLAELIRKATPYLQGAQPAEALPVAHQ